MSKDDPSEGGGSPARHDVLATARAWLAQGRPERAEPLLRDAIEGNPGNAAAWNELGRALNNLRRPDDAIGAFREAVRLDPELASAWNHLGHMLRATGRDQEAHDAFVRAVALNPTEPRAQRNLAGSLLRLGETEAGIVALREALATDPEDAIAHAQLGHALHGRGEVEAAATHYREALRLRSDLADAAAGLGALHQAAGDYAAAGARYRQALAADPRQRIATAGLAAILEIEGRHAEGLALLRPLLSDHPVTVHIAVTAARLLRRLGRSDEALTLIDRSVDEPPADEDAALLEYTRGDLLDELGDYPRAFEHYRLANARSPASFDPADFRRMVNRVIAFFSAERLAAIEDSGNESEQPVFIVGMPRSGTSLVEQILASHSSVRVGGERTELFAFVRNLAAGDPERHWPEILEATPRSRLSELARQYLQRTKAADCRRITDKLPANFLNLGLIRLLFPRARVVYCRRDPLDTGLSCFCQNFLSEGMAFARRLEHIAVYQQGCLRLMEHWMKIACLPVQIVDYEDLVNDLEPVARALIAFLGLPWKDACLRPDRSSRIVSTASYDQVRRPVYRSSVGRWRHYERELGPLKEALARPWEG